MSQQPADSPSSPPPPLSEPFPGGARRFLLPGLFVLGLFAVLIYRRPSADKPQQWVYKGRIFGTTYAVKVIGSKKFSKSKDKLASQITAKLNEVNRQMSTYKKDSELSLFNRSKSIKPVKVSKALARVAQIAKGVHKKSGGAFDVTIGPVINAWGFGPKKRKNPPSKEELDVAKKSIGSDKLTVDLAKATLQKSIPGLYVDLSAIAKGFAVDAVGKVIEKAGFKRYLVEIGGELRARGQNLRGHSWRVGVEKPDGGRQQVQLVVPLKNASMATSGNYRNFVMVKGKRVSHIIDARTASPITHHVASVSVIHEDCTIADAWATTLFVLGHKAGLELAKKEKLAVLFLVADSKGKGFTSHATDSFSKLLKKTSSAKPPKRR